MVAARWQLANAEVDDDQRKATHCTDSRFPKVSFRIA